MAVVGRFRLLLPKRFGSTKYFTSSSSSFLLIELLLIFSIMVSYLSSSQDMAASHNHHSKWINNLPPSFHAFQEYHDSPALLHTLPGQLIDQRKDHSNLTKFVQLTEQFIWPVDGFTDGEVVDAIEHFFWGMSNGLAIELGALDGSPNTRSMTYEYEKTLQWKRILIEGNPTYKENLKARSPLAFSAIAAICEKSGIVHFKPTEYVGGILEFMSDAFLRDYHGDVYKACNPPGNLNSLNFTEFEIANRNSKSSQIFEVECLPLSHILHRIHVKHVNFFILDVEGGELQILKSINWNVTRFDVLCIETEAANRPAGYADAVKAFLAPHGYHNVTMQEGRNTWFVYKDFQPSIRPGLDPTCYNGARKSMREDAWYLNRRTPKFQRCQLSNGHTYSEIPVLTRK